MSFKVSGKEFKKIKDVYFAYLQTYRLVNNGSLEGATPFHTFYIYKTFTSVYSDPRAVESMGYR